MRGSVTKVIDILRNYNARVISILTSFNDAPPGLKRVSIRITMDEDKLANFEDEVASLEHYHIIYHSKDELQNLPSKDQ